MGKSKRKSKKAAAAPIPQTQLPPVRPVASNQNSDGNILLPQSFPLHLSQPPKGHFLRDEKPYKESFREALVGPYEGFAVDEASALTSGNNCTRIREEIVQASLEGMKKDGYFRTDVTQPFGLGTKCAKTYVTRCLIGVPGTTYKYLGLRMFAHPWEAPAASDTGNANKRRKRNSNTDSNSDRRTVVGRDSSQIRELGKALALRTVGHLLNLDRSRRKRGAPVTRGRADFDVCLINRMESSPDLKPYVFGGGENGTKQPDTKTSVSWHADSSLEHYSTIAVYQTLMDGKDNNKPANDDKWWVALRVAHHSEGPQASQRRRGTNIEDSIAEDTPPIAASLPSGSAYYLLDDFNHHHQHTVLTTGDAATAGIRYSCTFRLLRDSHNIEDWIERGRTAVRQFHKKGPRVWRSEQLLLTKIESEWIRQFYVQGSGHYELLWESYWKKPMNELLSIWSQLEERTKQTMDLLRAAAEGKCGLGNNPTTNSNDDPATKPTKSERKARDRRKKSLGIVEELVSRLSIHEDETLNELYEPFAKLLEERAEMRDLWAKREKDHVFHEMPPDCRPMEVPFRFETESSSGDCVGNSPLPESKLKELAKQLVLCGRAYQEENASLLPPPWKTTKLSKESDDTHAKPMNWSGWDANEFGLELQDPWAGAVVDGRKSIETRNYPLPPSLIGKKIAILQSASGRAGVSGLGNAFDLSGDTTTKVIGWCRFSSVKTYTSASGFSAEEKLHLVTPESGYGWKDGVTKQVYGWVVGECHRTNDHNSYIGSGVRRFRSLFELQKPSESATTTTATAITSTTKKANTKRDKKNKSNGKRKRKRF